MKLDDFQTQFHNDVAFQQSVIDDINQAVQDAGIQATSNITAGDSGIASVDIIPANKDTITTLAVSAAALNVLQRRGLTDIANVAVFDPKLDPLAWNVVYKGGGWVVNGMEGGGFDQ